MRFYSYLLLLIVLASLWWVRLVQDRRTIAGLPDGALVRVRGFVTAQPYHKDSFQIIEIGRFSVRSEPFPRYDYGDFVSVSGTLKRQVTSSGKIGFFLNHPSFLATGNDFHAPVFRGGILFFLSELRAKIVRGFSALLPEPQASLLSGIVLGARRELPEEFEAALRRTGTLHVVVASGYNVTVVAGMIMAFLTAFFPRVWTVPFAAVGIGAYVLMAGAEPPVVRAGLMGLLALSSQLLGREYHGLWALALTGMAMLVFSPLLVFDLGFQLSVLATLGILVVGPLFSSLVRFFPSLARSLVEEGGVVLGAQLMVAPLLLFHFGQGNWLSPLVNLIVSGIVPLIMAMGGILAGVSFLWDSLARVVALFAWVPLSAFVSIVSWFDRLPVGEMRVAPFSWWWVVGYYAGVALVVWRLRRIYD